jgi:hypothetical protein
MRAGFLEMRISRYGKRKILEDAGRMFILMTIVRFSPFHVRKKMV